MSPRPPARGHGRTLLLMILLGAATAEPAPAQEQRWFRGNTHAHTTNSDGDSPPDSVARWYRDAKYHFLFITDHEMITDPAALNARFAAPGAFLLIPGQEVTQVVLDQVNPTRRRQAHVNGLGVRSVVRRQGENGVAAGISIADTYARNIAGIRAAGGIPQVNHPNFRWSVELGDLAALPDSTLFEVWNAHPGVNNLGGTDSTGRVAVSAEALWDSLLTRGKVVFAVADDDSHSFRGRSADEYSLTRPGRAWIMVRADTLTEPAIMRAIHRGDFYASTGVTLGELTLGASSITLSVIPVADSRYTTEFIGAGGRVLETVHGTRARYDFGAGERYVRARIMDSNGQRAWTQAVHVR